MKNKTTLITIVLTVVFIILGFFAYMKFIRSAYLNNPMKTEEFVLGQGQSLVLVKNESQTDIYNIEIEVTGEVSGIFDMVVSNEETPVHVIALKGKEIEYTYKGDWYSDTCFVSIEGRDDATGKLTINYRFLGMN
jgi:hypothetical protein